MKKVKGRWKNLIHSMFRHLLRKEKSHNVAIVRSLAMKRKILGTKGSLNASSIKDLDT